MNDIELPPREGFVFYKIFLDMISELKPNDQLKIYAAITNYAIYREEPEFSGIIKAVWSAIKDHLDRSLKNYDARKSNAKKGGAPKGKCNNPYGRRGKPSPEDLDNQTESKQEQTIINQELTENKPRTNINNNINNNNNININNTYKGRNELINKIDLIISNFFHEYNLASLEKFCMSLRCSIDEVREYAERLKADWILSNETDLSERHFINALRSKINYEHPRNNKNATQQEKYANRRGVDSAARSAADFVEEI